MSATLENIDDVDDRLAAYLSSQEVPVEVFAVRILLRESLLNAVTHGSGKDPSKTVHMEVKIDSDGIELDVRDSGPGFPWCDRRKDFDILGDGGRGLALMEIYSDEMIFNDKGNHLTLRKAFKSASVSGCTSHGND